MDLEGFYSIFLGCKKSGLNSINLYKFVNLLKSQWIQ